jgi:hypothetical protein
VTFANTGAGGDYSGGVTAARETRLPSDAELGEDWYDVLEAVFSHVDNVLGRKQAGLNADEFAARPRDSAPSGTSAGYVTS